MYSFYLISYLLSIKVYIIKLFIVHTYYFFLIIPVFLLQAVENDFRIV